MLKTVILIKEIKEYLNKWRNPAGSWTGLLSRVKMSALKFTCKFDTIPIKIPAGIFL